VGDYLFAFICRRSFRGHNGRIERIPANRIATIFLPRGVTVVTLPRNGTVRLFRSREDAEFIWGAAVPCDAKGIIAAIDWAAGNAGGSRGNFGLLFVVGEERNSAGQERLQQLPWPRDS